MVLFNFDSPLTVFTSQEERELEITTKNKEVRRSAPPILCSNLDPGTSESEEMSCQRGT